MTSGELPCGAGNAGYPGQLNLCLQIGEDEVLRLNHDNTSVYSSLENPDVDCIEITRIGRAGSVAGVHRIFERLDLTFGLVALGFPVVTSTAASADRQQAYSDWVASEDADEWAVISRDGVSLSNNTLEAITPITNKLTVTEAPLTNSVSFKVTPDNSDLFYFVNNSTLAHIRLPNRDASAGVAELN